MPSLVDGHGVAIALHDYASSQPDEIPLRRGDRVRISVSGEPGWADGEHLASGRRGLVPLSHLHTAASPATRVSVSSAGVASADVHDRDESPFYAAIEHHCRRRSLSWSCVHQALRSHVGLPLDSASSPVSLAHDLSRLIGAAPLQIAFLQPMLLPPQPMPRPPCGEDGSVPPCRYLAALGPEVPPYAYPPPHEEQFNAQRFGLMELMYLARAGGRVLVEPLLHLMPRDDVAVEAGRYGPGSILGHRREPATSFFNASRLAAYVPLVGVPAFLRASGRRLDHLWRLSPPLGCAHERAGAHLARVVGESGLEAYGQLLEVAQESCEDGPRSRPLSAYMAEGEAVVGLWRYRRGWLHGETVRWPEHAQHAYWEARRHLAFRDELWAEARAFAAEALGGEPFVALHWRRGDRTHPEMGQEGGTAYAAVAPAAVIRHARRLLRLRPSARRVLLLTNSGVVAELDELGAALPLVRYAPRGGGGGGLGAGTGWRTLQHDSIVEQILASLAEAFLAGPWDFEKLSTFARVIVEERVLLGQPANSTFYMQPHGKLVMQLESDTQYDFSQTLEIEPV